MIQVTKVWWDGERLMAEPIVPEDFFKHEVDAPDDWSEWVNPNSEQYFMKCCDCGLVHEMQFKVVKYSEGDECEFVADVDLQAVFRARRATPSAAPVQEPDWKAEYLKSVESGCTTLDELREARAELDATNRQVEILSDALAESRREVAALKAVQEDWGPGPHEVHSLPPAQPAPVQEPVAWRNAAIRVGEDLCSVGPFGYYDMTAEQWLDWALSVVTVHAPPAAQRQWVGLTDEEVENFVATLWPLAEEPVRDRLRAIEAKLKEKNT